MNPLVERFWIPVSGIVPVIALALILEVRAQARKFDPANGLQRRVMSAIWVALGICLALTELQALYFMARNQTSGWWQQFAIWAIALGLGSVISEPLWRLFGALNADIPDRGSAWVKRVFHRIARLPIGNRLVKAEHRQAQRVKRSEDLLRRSRETAEIAAVGLEYEQRIRDSFAWLPPDGVEARNLKFMLASKATQEVRRVRHEIFDVMHEAQLLLDAERRRPADLGSDDEELKARAIERGLAKVREMMELLP